MATKKQPTTSMTIKEVVETESGGLVINVVAKRGRRTYKLPYHIAPAKIHEVDLEMLKIKVKQDIDARESEINQRKAVVNKLGLQIGQRIPID